MKESLERQDSAALFALYLHRRRGHSGGAPMKILIIDDEPNIRHMMRLTLEPAGYEVDEAGDGETGIDYFRGVTTTRSSSIRRCP